ncbi:unnamed protein product [Triticum turgidum subsp. durum]|uniref:non-specific serine/threonine protein kinase n=1 Tax=Triticum turgidum subsp. durum TaxID=4567 RepID=A0A9R1AVM6_TRITD|nr:unnamed protein product [Triticum turgidum subsp. durum]
MDTKIGTINKVDLERMVLDRSAEPTYLPLSLLEDITDCFSDDQQIGSGGFSIVYKGMVGGKMVAVKKLSQTMHENKFHKEVECITKAKHKNIVRFLGYCSDTQGRIEDYEGKFVMADVRNWLLCFEYVPNGSLIEYITDPSRGLEWRERYQIIKGICEGLLHLHEKRILHLDLKPSNILIDIHMVPKIADFGLSRCLDKDQTRDFTSNICGSLIHGTRILHRTSHICIRHIQSWYYNYGDSDRREGVSGRTEVVENWMNRLEAADQKETQLEQVRACTTIGIECMDPNPKKRPFAHHIVNKLDKTASIIETGITSPSVEHQVRSLKEQHSQRKIVDLSLEYLLKEQHSQRKILDLSFEYLIKDMSGRTKTEELMEFIGAFKDHWRHAKEHQWSLRGVQGTKKNTSQQQGASISSSNSVVLNKLNIFSTKARRNYARNGGPMLEKIDILKLFKKEELKPAINDKNRIGRDVFEEVYIGLVDRVPVIVKKQISGTVLQNGQFAKEVIIQSQVLHKNIVRLIGCCVEVDIPMLVYEYLSKDSLHDILHNNCKVRLNLGVRLNIATESARGLAYMHSRHNILHGNIKSENILLDDHFVPKISNFCISRLTGRGYKHTRTVKGDDPYMDPLYLQTGLLSEYSDVYSFGVVMLELLTRKKATHSDNNSLVRNFLENHKQGRKSTELFDEKIAVMENLELLDNLAQLVVKCLSQNLDLRPKMIDVAKRLHILNESRGQWVLS